MSPTEGTANGTTNASGLVKYLSKNAGPAPGAPATAGGAPGSAAPPDAPSGGTWSRVKTYLSENKADIASKGLTTAFLGWIGWDIGKKTYDTTERLGTEAGQQQALKSTVQAEYGILWFELGLMTTGALLTGGVWAPIAVLYGATVVVYGTEQSNQMVNRASPGLQ